MVFDQSTCERQYPNLLDEMKNEPLTKSDPIRIHDILNQKAGQNKPQSKRKVATSKKLKKCETLQKGKGNNFGVGIQSTEIIVEDNPGVDENLYDENKVNEQVDEDNSVVQEQVFEEGQSTEYSVEDNSIVNDNHSGLCPKIKFTKGFTQKCKGLMESKRTTGSIENLNKKPALKRKGTGTKKYKVDKKLCKETRNDAMNEKGKESEVASHKIKRQKGKRSIHRTIRTRSSPKALYGTITCLKPDQKKCLIEMGFGSLIGMFADEIPTMLGYYVVDKFDPEKMELMLHDGSIEVTAKAVHDMLGVPNGGKSIMSLEPRASDDPFIKDWKAQFQTSEIRPNDILDVIVSSNDAGRMFKMNFLMLFANTMAACESNGVCSMTVLKQISDDVHVETLDWCGFLLECLNPLLYLDSTRCDAFPVIRQRPAIKCWNLVLMRCREKLEVNGGGFGKLPKREIESETELQEEVFHAKIEENYNIIYDELVSLYLNLKEASSIFPLSDKLKQSHEKFAQVFGKKDLLNDNIIHNSHDDVVSDV
ncbi:hypothetical protein CTI12_AA597780 [Artemisia annua]|uniref:Ulp1 protease family, C-terminal catalytic domain-containing protein n=1 Tax=Artemisia annua TaxID=35608 RepID=A0A2U1KIU5_ARTAN|nr:hypothetical protein CTI12_AA597780 [Artemisia annua]